MTTVKISALPNPTGTLDGTELNPVVQSGVTVKAASNALGYKRTGTGTTARTLTSKVGERVSVKDFGAACDGTTNDTAAVQAAIDYCAANNWPTLVIPGKCRINSSLIINRLVDQNSDEFFICGEGPDAGFFTAGNVTIFNSTLPYTTAPQSEFVTFDNIRFESSSFFNASYVLSPNFLRIKFQNCVFFLIRCMISPIYAQTMYFLNCNIRNNPPNFLNVTGSYDIKFTHCIIENGFTIIRSVDPARGTNSLTFTSCVIEGMQGSIGDITGATGFALTNCYLEANFSPDFNFFAGGVVNKSICITGNFINNTVGPSMYYGPTEYVFSAANSVFPNLFHDNAIQCTNLISTADYAPGGITFGANVQVVNGVTRAGNASTTAWTDTSNQFAKDTSGRFGVGLPIQGDVKFAIAGSDQTSANYTNVMYDSAGNVTIGFRNDRQIWMPALGNYADDAAAATAGISVGNLYRTGSVIKVRVV